MAPPCASGSDTSGVDWPMTTVTAVVANGDVGALSSALGSLVSDPALRKRLGDAARQRVAEEFSPARSFSTVVGIYQRLTGAPLAALSAAGAQ